MPDHIGAFYKASKCFADLGINITRVSYNKAIDSHLLFIDAKGTPEQLLKADEQLRRIGYLQSTDQTKNVSLLEFRIRDVPGGVTGVLALISEFHFNISYISSQENGTDYQLFKMGLFVESKERLQEFLHRAEELCHVSVIDYNHADKIYDNSIFYTSFVSDIAKRMEIQGEKKEELLVNTNLAMQTLDEKGMSPYRTFDSISRFTELLSACRKNAFLPRISRQSVTKDTEILLIEPACGSNTAILLHHGAETNSFLFIDTGYACYEEEMKTLFRELLPEFFTSKKSVLITHADVDHCGLLPLFDEIIASEKSALCLKLEYEGKNGLREQNPLHKPYIRICKILTAYLPPKPENVVTPFSCPENLTSPLTEVSHFSFFDLHFTVYEGKGGHLPGELVLIDFEHKIVFTGDIYLNLRGMTKEQAAYNQYAPILMTSVDTDKELCAAERDAILALLPNGTYKIYGAHGACKELVVNH